ncbi:MAG TPA: hypothetical protein VJT67_02345 [Longimicrobiaceae bacterium]|nr:hypothetical protein [Longimicrobiaceae bacterium]
MTKQDATGPSRRRRNVIVGAAVVAIVAVVTVGRCSGMSVHWRRSPYHVYFPGTANVAAKMPVRLGRDAVGTVTKVHAPVRGLQVSVLPGRTPAVPEVATLWVGHGVRLRNDATLRLESTDRAVIRWNQATAVAARTGPGEWQLTAPDNKPPALFLNGEAILTHVGERVALVPGDRLAFGQGPRAVQVYWGDVDFLTRADLSLDADRFTIDGGRPPPGTGVALLTGFGHPGPELELRPSLDRDSAVVMGQDTTGELAPIASADPLATVQAVVSYLGSPAALRQPPSNRIERAIASADLSLAHLSEVAGEFSAAARGKQSGILLRLFLNAEQRRNTDQALDRLASILDQVDRSGRGDAPGVVGRLALTADQQRNLSLLLASAGDVNRSVRNVSSITGRFAGRDSTVVARLAGPRADSLVVHLTGLTGRLAGPRTDSILTHVDSLTSELSNRNRSLLRRVGSPDVDTAAAKARAGLASVKKPATVGFVALLGLIIASTAHHVADIVR